MDPDDGFIDFDRVDEVYKLYRKSEEKNREFDVNDLLDIHEWDEDDGDNNYEDDECSSDWELCSDEEEDDDDEEDDSEDFSDSDEDQPKNTSNSQVVINDILKVLKKSNKKVENCNRCYETKILYEKHLEEFEKLKKKVEELNKKAQMRMKESDDVRRDLEQLTKDKDYEVKNLRENFLQENRKLEEENEKLKKDLETKEKRIQQLHQQFKTEEATNLTWKLENEQMTKVLREQLGNVSENANRKDIEMNELKIRNSELEKELKNLLEKYHENQRHIGFLENNMVSVAPPGLSLKRNLVSVEEKMKEYEKIMKIDFGSALSSMTEIINKFETLKPSGNLEIEIFKQKYLDFVKLASDKYKNNDFMTEIPDLSKPFSLEFMASYERLLKNKNKKEKKGEWEKFEGKEKEKELEDNECLICTYDMEFYHRSTKCENCSRKYHRDCVSEWLKLNSICPVCRVSLPDPNEYPTL